MNTTERIRRLRKELGLSQSYVAELLKVPRTAVTAIEMGTRELKVEELKKLSEIYGVTSEEILYGSPSEDADVKMFARSFSELSENDKKEIMNLIEFKKRLEM